MPMGVKRFFVVDLTITSIQGIPACGRDEPAIDRSRRTGKDNAPDAPGTLEIQLTRKPPTGIL